MLKNTHWFRHFLICDKIAKEVCDNHGWIVENFAKVILDEQENGVFTNSQMTAHFWAVDRVLALSLESDPEYVFDALEEEFNTSLHDLAKMGKQELNHYFNSYVIGEISI